VKAAPAGAIYFALVFAAGAVLGPIRELIAAPRLGAFAAVALEAPLMLAVVFMAARSVVARLDRDCLRDRLMVGATGFGLLLVAEVLGSMALRQMSLGDWLGHFARPEGAVSLALFLIFAAMPVAVRRRT
jgi:hypothetical protein